MFSASIIRLNSLLISLCVLFFVTSAWADTLPQVQLQIGMHIVKAEVAANNESRMQGLMFRKNLEKNQGMLFVFDSSDLHAMWMKNTPLPLSVAFIDEKGVILNIEEMKPFTDAIHAATKPAKYALEMNSGWFNQKGIKAGDIITNLKF